WDPNGNAQFDAGGNGVYDDDIVIFDEAVAIPVFAGTTIPVNSPSRASQLSVAPTEVVFEPFDEDGNCLVGTTIGIQAVPRDQRNIPIVNVAVRLFTANGRAVVNPGPILTSLDTGIASGVLRSLCPQNPFVPIPVVATVFG